MTGWLPNLRCSTLLAAGLLLLLAGCGDDGLPQVQQWMAEVRQQTRIVVPKLSEPKKFIPFVYQVSNPIDPYSPKKLSAALAKLQASSGNGLKPNLQRRREPLESYPLDALRMVHFHIGSQIPDIQSIKRATREATRYSSR